MKIEVKQAFSRSKMHGLRDDGNWAEECPSGIEDETNDSFF